MFDNRKTRIKESVEARTMKIAGDEAWALLRQAEEIIVGRGRKYTIFDPAKDGKEDILAACLGRTGNLRAPALKIGRRCIIGFSEDMYNTYLG